MPTTLSDTDTWETAPDGPATGENRTSALIRSYLGKINNRARYVFNRITERLIGTELLIEAVDATTDIITITAHGLSNGDVVRVEARNGGTLPGNVTANTAYYVAVQDADNIKIKNTAGAGIAINISSNGTDDMYLVSVPDAFGSLVAGAASTVGTYVMPKAFNLTELLAYIASTLGTTFTGAVRFSGDEARIIKRATATIADAAAQTFDVTADVWYHAEPTAQRDPEVDDTGSENGDEIEVRRGAAGNFAIVLHRPGSAAAICTMPALTCCNAVLKRHGGVWTLLSYSGAVVPGAEAG
jgi:hypothetical protein